jgi:uncharacterized membrane protein YqjE
MAIDMQRAPDQQSLNALVGGIVSDVQTLLKQQLQLTRKELQSDLAKTARAAILAAIGTVLTGFGIMILCVMLALLIHWSVSPPNIDQGRIPLWGCFALVGVALTAVGGSLCWVVVRRAETSGSLLERSTKALEENLEWKSTTTSNRS